MKYTFDEAAFHARQERWKDDPRAINLQQPYEAFPASVDLQPENPVKLGESRFLELEVGQVYGKPFKWVNQENAEGYIYSQSEALAHMRAQIARPRIEQLTRPPRKHPDSLRFGRYLLVSDRVLEVFRALDPSVIETREVDLFYLKGERAPRYHFLLITRHLMAEDYSRSLVRVSLNKEVKSVEWMVPRAFQPDIEPQVHAFTAHYTAGTNYVSRELAAALAAVNPWKMRFLDPAGHYDIVRFEGHDSDWEN
jgi:Protein of unknown function (DUF1629)